MTRQKEWFSYLEKLRNPGVVSTGDDTPHPIVKVGEVPLNCVGLKNRSIVEAARAMLEEKSMPKFYWAEAVRTAVYIQNQIRDKVSAYEQYFGTKPNLRHLWVFGSIAYVHIPKEKRKKLDAKAEKCILVGYSDEQKGYKCYNPRTKQACVSRDVVFDESASWCHELFMTPGTCLPLRNLTPIQVLTKKSARPRCLGMSQKSGLGKRVRFQSR
jgi:hypothetical protein